MAIIPLKQRVIVRPPDGLPDKWGQTKPTDPVEYRARVSEEIRVVTNQYGEEAVASMTIYFDKLPDISYDHVIEYENEIGVKIARKPVSIEVKRHINGKPLLTLVGV